MAEPDYMDDDCDDLIKPKKLVNPVKTSRNHQDVHRELLMNQKRGLAPQDKPELQKVLEKRKRDQAVRQQMEEEEAHRKQSDLEVELQKRQQRLEQVWLMGRGHRWGRGPGGHREVTVCLTCRWSCSSREMKRNRKTPLNSSR
uniref:Family with sequence similarity 107 member B n=1 Tax=Paramormyrops kingsleyae TaxID=1676925 RepID=A0A3B3SZT1_9TELE